MLGMQLAGVFVLPSRSSFIGPLIGGYLSDLNMIRPLVYVFPVLKSVGS